MNNNTLFEMVNAPFNFTFAGKDYLIKKANLKQAVLYQTRLRELQDAKDPGTMPKICAYCLYLVLSSADFNITEDQVLEGSPANLDPLGLLQELGFIIPQESQTTQKTESQ